MVVLPSIQRQCPGQAVHPVRDPVVFAWDGGQFEDKSIGRTMCSRQCGGCVT